MYRVLDVVRNLRRADVSCSIDQADARGEFEWESGERWASIAAALRDDPGRKLVAPPMPAWVASLTRTA